MNIKISKTSTLQQILDQFNALFPYLKLEFYKEHHKPNEGSEADDQLAHDSELRTIQPDLAEIDVNITGEMTVAEFEKMMKSSESRRKSGCKLHLLTIGRSKNKMVKERDQLRITILNHWILQILMLIN